MCNVGIFLFETTGLNTFQILNSGGDDGENGGITQEVLDTDKDREIHQKTKGLFK